MKARNGRFDAVRDVRSSGNKCPSPKRLALRLEPLEPRIMLSTDLPGMQLVDPDVDHFEGQIVYLDFDGAEDVTYNGPVTIEGIDVPPFTAPGDLAGQEAAIIQEVTERLDGIFADSGVTFTTQEPEADTDCSTIFIGGNGDEFRPYGSITSIAEQVDVGNNDHSDNAFVFSDPWVSGLGDVEIAVSQLSHQIAHETGHLLGYAHDEAHPSDSALAEVATTYTLSWDTSNSTSINPITKQSQ